MLLSLGRLLRSSGTRPMRVCEDGEVCHRIAKLRSGVGNVSALVVLAGCFFLLLPLLLRLLRLLLAPRAYHVTTCCQVSSHDSCYLATSYMPPTACLVCSVLPTTYALLPTSCYILLGAINKYLNHLRQLAVHGLRLATIHDRWLALRLPTPCHLPTITLATVAILPLSLSLAAINDPMPIIYRPLPTANDH